MEKIKKGDILIAINECLMDVGSGAALTVGNEYEVIDLETDGFVIIDDSCCDHSYEYVSCDFYFKIKDLNATDKQVGGDHYKQLAIQPVEFIQKNGLKYCEANAIKYICRHRAKNGVQDIDKAIHYLELLKELEYKL